MWHHVLAPIDEMDSLNLSSLFLYPSSHLCVVVSHHPIPFFPPSASFLIPPSLSSFRVVHLCSRRGLSKKGELLSLIPHAVHCLGSPGA